MPRRRRKRPPRFTPPELTEKQILAWADAWFDQCRRWPNRDSGLIPGTLGQKWSAVDAALKNGFRGLPGGTSLGLLLASKRQAPYLRRRRRTSGIPPRLAVKDILAWAEAHHARTGDWPRESSGRVLDAPYEETWIAITSALRDGCRGLPGGSSLALVLMEQRGVRNEKRLPKLTMRQILAWAGAHRKRTGAWPLRGSGKIEGTDETWSAVDAHLRRGTRGLRGGSSLAEFLARNRQIPNRFQRPKLTEQLIRAWAGVHFRRNGSWPTTVSGSVLGAPRERWKSIDSYLRVGLRGLPGGSSLARLLGRLNR